MKRLLCVLLLALGTSALAHTAVTGIRPAAHATVSQPKAVQLEFSEAIPLRFATFKVYPLPAGDKLSLNRAAKALLNTALNAKNDASARADAWAGGKGTALSLSLPLKPNLKAGAYAVLWRFVSEDGHVVTGQSVFHVK